MSAKTRFLSGALALVTFAVGAIGCSSADESPDKTTGARIVLHTTITSATAANTPFKTNFGWNITLQTAAISVGALYFFDGPPAFTLAPPTRQERLLKVLGLGIAHAHPGHYQAGDAKGQMLTPSSYDLFSGAPQSLGDGDGITGFFRSGRFVFGDGSVGPASAALAGAAAMAQGKAEKADGTTPAPIYFAVAALFAEIAKQATDGGIDGCTLDEANVTASGNITVTVSPHVWFDAVDFSSVAPGTAAAPTVVAAGEKAHGGFVNGVSQLNAYHFAYSP